MAERLWLSVREVAERFGVSIDTAERWGRDGVIPSIKLGRTRRFHVDAIAEVEREGLPRASSDSRMFKTVPDVLGLDKLQQAHDGSERRGRAGRTGE